MKLDINFKKEILKEFQKNEGKTTEDIIKEIKEQVSLIAIGYVCGDRVSNSNRIVRI